MPDASSHSLRSHFGVHSMLPSLKLSVKHGGHMQVCSGTSVRFRLPSLASSCAHSTHRGFVTNSTNVEQQVALPFVPHSAYFAQNTRQGPDWLHIRLCIRIQTPLPASLYAPTQAQARPQLTSIRAFARTWASHHTQGMVPTCDKQPGTANEMQAFRAQVRGQCAAI